MKILHLRASNFYGGPERQLHIHAALAQKAGYEIIIASFSEDGKSPEFLQVIAGDGIKTHLFGVRNAYDMRAIALIKQYVIDFGIDIICTHDYRSHLIVYRAIKDTKAKWIAFSRGWTKDTLRVRVYSLLDKIFIRFADHIVAVSQAQKNKLTRLFVPSDMISVVHNAIELERLSSIEKVDIRKRFGFSEDNIIAISGGRFSFEKGQAVLVRAAELAIKKNNNLRFVLFGNGPDLDKIKALIKHKKLEEKVFCPGFEKNLLGCLKSVDMLINPSFSEGLPNIVLEAMALKVPVVATSVGGVPELIVDGESGLLVPAGNWKSMAEAIVKVSQNADLQRRIAEKGYDTISKSFTFNGQLQALEAVYKKVLDKI
jgi:glycosyltransferase involved in cell wall biosynthesis